jgi:hypothetical protein
VPTRMEQPSRRISDSLGQELFEVDRASDKRLKRRITLGFFGGVQPPVGKVTNTGRKTEAQQVAEAKHVVGEAGRVGIVLFDSQVRFMLKAVHRARGLRRAPSC